MFFSQYPFLAKTLPLVAVLVLTYYVKRRGNRRSKLPLPPGPKPHWLFGNELPKSNAPVVFAQLAKEYGPVFSLRKANQTYVIICGRQAAIDIMEKENAFLADRPHSIAAGEIMSDNKKIFIVPYGDRFRKMRKALQPQLHGKILETYEPVLDRNARNVVLDILDQPDRHMEHVKRYAAGVIMTLLYGKQTPTFYSDPEIQAVNKYTAQFFKAVVPWAYLVDSYPIMRYIPGYLSGLRRQRDEEFALFKSQIEGVREKMRTDPVQPCIAKYFLEKQRELELDDDEVIYLAGFLLSGGSYTPSAALSIVIMAAALFPDAQRQVQEQLDEVVGRDRMPSFGDMDALTAVTAFYLETYRWRPAVIGGVPHRATKDIIYGPYVIPEGAIVLANHWAIGRDAEFYPQPEEFIPSRWITETGQINEKIKFYNFGFGRRVCPALHVVNRTLFINTAFLLWAFNITQDPSAPIDKNAFIDAPVSHPLPFRVKFEPRIPNLRELVEKSA